MTADLRVANDFLEMLLQHPDNASELPTGTKTFYEWNENLPFSSETYTVSLEKKPDRDFVILNFADVQCHDTESFDSPGAFAVETMDKLIRTAQPDLITLTGDNAFDAMAYMHLIDFIEKYEIPWAPVMGNADMRDLSEFWADYRLHNAKHCLFQYGPEHMGDGNYIINIKENGKTVHTLYMMDTHHEETMQTGSYDHLYPNQIAWYRWAVQGITKEENHTVPSSVFIHIPVPEYKDAWKEAHDGDGNLLPAWKDMPFCCVEENMGAPNFNNGFFALCEELGSTKNILCGHDHTNCFSLPYHGINLCYTMKTGYGCYWKRKTNGGTVLKIRSDGTSEISHIYINPAESQVKGFMLDYYGVNLYGTGGKCLDRD